MARTIDIIERRARAICRASGIDPDAISSFDEQVAWILYWDHALATLEADKAAGLKLMARQATNDMDAAGGNDIFNPHVSSHPMDRAASIFSMMWVHAPWWPGEGK